VMEKPFEHLPKRHPLCCPWGISHHPSPWSSSAMCRWIEKTCAILENKPSIIAFVTFLMIISIWWGAHHTRRILLVASFSSNVTRPPWQPIMVFSPSLLTEINLLCHIGNKTSSIFTMSAKMLIAAWCP
jgi:hypothetical protein